MKKASLVLLGLLSLTAACSKPSAEKTNTYSEADASAGKAKFEQNCATCHGATGQGDGPAAAALNPKPRNLTDKAYMSTKEDAHLQKVIEEGGAAVNLSATMPAWKGILSEQETKQVIAYVRSLAK